MRPSRRGSTTLRRTILRLLRHFVLSFRRMVPSSKRHFVERNIVECVTWSKIFPWFRMPELIMASWILSCVYHVIMEIVGDNHSNSYNSFRLTSMVPFYYLFPIYGYPKFIHNSFLDIQKSIYGYPEIHFWISNNPLSIGYP